MNHIFKYHKLHFIYLTIVIAIRQLLLVIAQQVNANMFDALVDKHIQNVTLVISLMILVWILVIALDAFVKIRQENVSLEIQKQMRVELSEKITKTSFQEHSEISSGKYLSWLNNDMAMISQKGINQYFNLVHGATGVLFAAIAIVQYHWSLLLLTGVGFICMLYIPKLFDKKVQQMSKDVSEGNEAFVSKLENHINGYPVYFALSAVTHFVNCIKLASEGLNKVLKKQVKLDTSLVVVNFSINVFFQILLTIVATICYFNGWVALGAVAVVGSLADIIFSGLGNISYQLSSIKSITPIIDKFDQLPEESRVLQELTFENEIYHANKLKLSYNEEVVFDDLSFSIRANDKCLIQGASGSGKSSLLNILLGYHKDFQGELTYKGVDMNTLSSWQISQEVIYLSQQTYLFEGSVRENINLDRQFTIKELEEVLRAVGFIDNIEYLLNLQANQLSGGQKQRIALARSLIRKPQVIICDEITSALDKDSAKYIEKLLLSDENRTVIMVTHVLNVDRKLFDVVLKL